MYELTVIGAGWAGFNAARKASVLGLKTCLIERADVGGTCLNRGCIPTKALIQSAKVYSLARKASNFGVNCPESSVDLVKAQERKEKIVSLLGSGMHSLLKGVDLVRGQARFASAAEIIVSGQTIKTKYALIATGSMPAEIPGLKFDGVKVISSDDALGLTEIPGNILIVGGGVIGCEFASLFSALGSKVTIAEKMPQMLAGIDSEVVRKIGAIFKKKGIQVFTSADALKLDIAGFDKVLVCVGRVSQVQGLGLEQAGVVLERGNISVDDYLRTSIENIYAAGDCSGGIMLAHYAAYQGEVAVENIASGSPVKKCAAAGVPSCIFTDPEIATVGINEDQARAENIDIQVAKFDFLGSGMARILDETEGFIKVVIDRSSQRVLGGSIIGPRATELISVLGLAVSCGLTAKDIRNTIFAHPTLSESIHEALAH